jgi:hypothetical protein
MFKKLRNTIEEVKNGFWLFITTMQNNTAALRALAAEQKELRTKLDTLVDHSAFQVRVKRAELNRAGHRAD